MKQYLQNLVNLGHFIKRTQQLVDSLTKNSDMHSTGDFWWLEDNILPYVVDGETNWSTSNGVFIEFFDVDTKKRTLYFRANDKYYFMSDYFPRRLLVISAPIVDSSKGAGYPPSREEYNAKNNLKGYNSHKRSSRKSCNKFVCPEKMF